MNSSDPGTNFRSKVVLKVCLLFGIHKARTTLYQPRSDGFIKRSLRTLGRCLKAVCRETRQEWEELMPLILMSYRATPQASTGVTPNMMMLGRQTRLPSQAMYGTPLGPDEPEQTVSKYVATLQDGLRAAYCHDRAGLQLAASHQRYDYDGKVQRREYQAGELVWVHNVSGEVPGRTSPAFFALAQQQTKTPPATVASFVSWGNGSSLSGPGECRLLAGVTGLGLQLEGPGRGFSGLGDLSPADRGVYDVVLCTPGGSRRASSGSCAAVVWGSPPFGQAGGDPNIPAWCNGHRITRGWDLMDCHYPRVHVRSPRPHPLVSLLLHHGLLGVRGSHHHHCWCRLGLLPLRFLCQLVPVYPQGIPVQMSRHGKQLLSKELPDPSGVDFSSSASLVFFLLPSVMLAWCPANSILVAHQLDPDPPGDVGMSTAPLCISSVPRAWSGLDVSCRPSGPYSRTGDLLRRIGVVLSHNTSEIGGVAAAGFRL